MKRFLSLILVILLIIGSTTSCNGRSNSDNQSNEFLNNDVTAGCVHIDSVLDHICENCGAGIGVHADKAGDGDHKCDYCKAVMSLCEDNNKNHKCDECKTKISAHEDSANDGNHKCDYCNSKMTSNAGKCSDNDNNHKCDECGIVISTCEDTSNDHNHNCDACGLVVTDCSDVDSDKNHECDECGIIVTECNDKVGDGNHNCDDCDLPMGECVDGNFNHSCDECSATMGEHIDATNDGNHLCDYCKEAIGICNDIDLDGVCEECAAHTESYERTGEKISFGSYPQSEVTDNSLKNALNSKAGTLPNSSNAYSWTSYGYYRNGQVENFMWYIDIEYDGEKYRGVYFTFYRESYENVQENNGYITGTVYWFKYEPLSWTILSQKKADSSVFIFCDMIIDAQRYDYYNGEYYSKSTVRSWLNEVFYDTAFNEIQKEMIITSLVDNSAEIPGYSVNHYVSDNTQDKIFLLSYMEARNSNYGLNNKEIRQKKITDYAKMQGGETGTWSYSNNGFWLLRSPHPDGYYICMYGDGGGYYDEGCSYIGGIVPALWVKL